MQLIVKSTCYLHWDCSKKEREREGERERERERNRHRDIQTDGQTEYWQMFRNNIILFILYIPST